MDGAVDVGMHAAVGAGGASALDGHAAVDGGFYNDVPRHHCPPAKELSRPPDSGPCQWKVPFMRGAFDPQRVNLELYTSDGGLGTTLALVPGPASCDSAVDGWYFDDATDPSSVALCPSACVELQGSSGARVAILIGCDA
jgi:hypothetical protein